MKRSNDHSSTVEKERIRDEIDAQVAAFLSAGGKIHVLHSQSSGKPVARGSVWPGPDELGGISR